jgi:hypothetical protein
VKYSRSVRYIAQRHRVWPAEIIQDVSQPNCTPIGSPPWLVPNLIDKPGSPVTLNGAAAEKK